MKLSDSNSQASKVYEHIKKHGSITTLEAFRLYTITRLSAQIYILKNQYNVPICGEMVTVKDKNVTKRYKRYYLEDKDGRN